MTPQETIHDSLWNWPSLYHSSGRAGVLGNLFFVIGNGFDWVNGELVHIYEDDRIEDDLDDDYIVGEHDDDYLLLFRTKIKKEWDDVRNHVRDNIDVYELSPGMPRSLYPLSDHAKIITIPDDVTDEWLTVAIEAASIYCPLYHSIGYYGHKEIFAHLNGIRTRLNTLAKEKNIGVQIDYAFRAKPIDTTSVHEEVGVAQN